MGLTHFTHGITSMGIPIIGQPFGNTYFVDASGGSNGNIGTNTEQPWKTLTYAFTRLSHYDTLILKPGNYTGNYTTPVNATAAFVRVIGMRTHDQGLAVWMGATTASSPIIDVLARGWSFDGIEFDCPTSSSGVRLTSSTSNSPNRSDFTTFKNCIFTTGKYGIEVNGGNTHITVRNCKFDQLTESGAHAIHVTATGRMIPAFWIVEDNYFLTSTNHIGPGNATRGFSSSIFKNNVFDSATVALDIRASGGINNVVAGNYFDVVIANFDALTEVIGNATDYGAGNFGKDGAQAEKMAGTT